MKWRYLCKKGKKIKLRHCSLADKWVYSCYVKIRELFSLLQWLNNLFWQNLPSLISLGKYSNGIGRVHHHQKSERGRHIRHREETRGFSVGSDRVDRKKMPGMLRKHSFQGSQTDEEGNKSIYGAWRPTPTHTRRTQVVRVNHSFSNQC